MGSGIPAVLLMLADGRLPSGGHAHSGGLEEAVWRKAVVDSISLEAWLRGRLYTTGLLDAGFAAVAAHEAVARRDGRDDRLDCLAAELAARLPSAAARRASRAQGRGLLRTAAAAWPAGWISDLRTAEAPWPLALGAASVAAGLAAPEAAMLGALAAVQGPAWAATRLLGLDPFDVAAVLARLAGSVDAVAGRAGASGADWTTDDLPAGASPLTDIGAEIHATWEVRLFAS